MKRGERFKRWFYDWRTPSRLLRVVCVVLLIVALGRAIAPYRVHESTADATQRVEATIERVEVADDQQKLTLDSGILAFVPRYPSLAYGDYVRLMCELAAPEPFDGFAYDRYLAAKGIHTLCFARQTPIVIEHDQGTVVMGTLQSVRSTFLHQIDLTFGEPHGSLLAGLLFGEKRFSDAWEERFVRTGTSHIVAASGYNVAMVAMIAGVVLAGLGIRRKRAFAFLLAAIAGYALFAALETAVVRAAIMAILVVCSQQVGRKTTMTNALLLTAAIMLTVNPRLLFDDVAFSLSFLSTIGLIYLAPHWQQRWTWMPERWLIRESFTSTLAATLMSLPILLFQFGRVSLISVITNVLILPTIPFVMASGAMATMTSFVSLDVARVLSLPAVAGLNWMLWIVKVSAEVPLYLPVPIVIAVVLFVGWLILIKRLWMQNVLPNRLVPLAPSH